MSLLLQLNILFCIFLLKSWKLCEAAAIYYPDYNNLDVHDRDYWDNYDTYLKRQANEFEDNFPPQCRPIVYATTTESTPTTSTCTPTTATDAYDSANAAEAEDIIENIIAILRSMRQHAIGLIRNMNELEMDILSSSASSNLEALCKNSTMALAGDTMNGMEKIVYPDVLSQTPGYVISEWGVPIKTEVAKSEGKQTNEFVAEAQEAVKSWKQQIETCKRILDDAVQNALLKANMKSDLMADSAINLKHTSPGQGKVRPYSAAFRELSRDLKQEQEKSNSQVPDEHFRIKEGDF